ncbi:zinc finger protein 507 [Brachionichthys hirsutus]|uniref:zinc finger protein 507 n=1 Tax=Brachionichthys hirsutus TaxID=412623 RepID=UPI003604A7BE
MCEGQRASRLFAPIMEEISDVAALISNASTASSSFSVSLALGSISQTQTQPVVEEDTSGSFQQKQAADSLIQVIEKLSKIVDKRPRHCALAVERRAIQRVSSAAPEGGEEGMRGSRGGFPNKRIKSKHKEQGHLAEDVTFDDALFSPAPGDGSSSNIIISGTEVATNSYSSAHKLRTVTCYQCSLCPYLSYTLPLLKEHLKQHNEQHTDLILMCSECRFASRDQGQLEAHVRLHFNSGDDPKMNSAASETCNGDAEKVLRRQGEDWTGRSGGVDANATKSPVDGSKELPPKKKWYSYEEYGLYRCLICSYVCSQQRMLKTHAWKHAGLVDCSYPIFEDEDETPTKKEAQVSANTGGASKKVVLSQALEDKSLKTPPHAFKLQLFSPPLAIDNKQDALSQSDANLNEAPTTSNGEEESAYPVKDLTSVESMVEVQVTTEAEVDTDGPHDNNSITDSLLSSAQKIIHSSPNSAGHVNVIVERLPSAEDSTIATSPLILGPDMDRDENLLDAKDEEPHSDGVTARTTDGQQVGANLKLSVPVSCDSPRDENTPPVGRKRTHSESLRLHSLAAEALVAMPMRTPELPTCGTKVSLKTITTQSQSQNMSQKFIDVTAAGPKTSDSGSRAALLDLEHHSEARDEDLGSWSLGEGDEDCPAAKAGISLSLLTVIERLRERSDQNASDEDILKELQDNAQLQNGSVASMVTGNGSGSYMCGVPGMDGLVASTNDGLVDYVPDSERPYQCRLCRYSSGNKGYIKQHLRVHRQRQPYQCPICEHIASDSKDLESHMIHHCKTRTYQCKLCSDAFHYKSELRNHERERHSLGSDIAALTPVTETTSMLEDAEAVKDEECGVQKMYKCDVCDYTSGTYVGVRNHRRIHNSDKPYRCCSCDFATTNMNSLKSHMRKHPDEQHAMRLLEQYRCSLCGYVCSHPPSLKSHMWKHAGDQNYNYEQVNKAINEAISQSSRAPQKVPAALEPVAATPKDDSRESIATAAEPAVGRSLDPTDHPGGVLSESSNPARQPQSQSMARAGHAPVPGPGMEYCVLLFCCCICGFESTSKDRLMEHMKEHEGDIISIILNKEQQQQPPPPGPRPGLQALE